MTNTLEINNFRKRKNYEYWDTSGDGEVVNVAFTYNKKIMFLHRCILTIDPNDPNLTTWEKPGQMSIQIGKRVQGYSKNSKFRDADSCFSVHRRTTYILFG